MITYTVHEPPEPPSDRIDRAERLVFVKEGFHWLAAILGPIWLIAKGLWLALLVYLALVVLLGLALAAAGASDNTAALTSLGLHLILGFEADSIQRLTLDRRGWRMVGTASGHTRDECERRFFEAWLPGQPMVAPDYAIAARSGAPRSGTLAAAADGELALAPSGASSSTVSPPAQRSGWRRLVRRG